MVALFLEENKASAGPPQHVKATGPFFILRRVVVWEKEKSWWQGNRERRDLERGERSFMEGGGKVSKSQ